MVLWQHVVLCESYGAESAPDCVRVCVVLCCVRLTQHNTQHQVNIRKLFSECFLKI